MLVAGCAASQWGVISLAQLEECGLSQRAITTRVRNGGLHRVYRKVYAVGHPGLPLEGRFLAAVAACGPGAVLSHFSAGALWGFVEWDDRPAEVTVLGLGARRHEGVRVHRTHSLDAPDVTERKGIPVTAPARTVLDLAAQLGYHDLRRAVRQGQARGLVDLAQIMESMHRLGPRRGCRKVARIIASGHAPTRSMLEDRVLDLIVGGGFAHPDVNVPLVVAGRTVIPDFRWPADRIVVEADGAAWHDHKLARGHDVERQALLEAHGERILRVTWEQAVRRPAETVRRLRAAGVPSASGT